MRNTSTTMKLILRNRRASSTTLFSLRNASATNASSSSSSTAVVERSQRFSTSGANTTNSGSGSMGSCCSSQCITSLNKYSIHNTKRSFSQEATSSDTNDNINEQEEYVFKHPKSQEIFEKLNKLQLEEVRTVVELMYEKMGVTITEGDKLRAKGGRPVAMASSGDAEEAEVKVEKTHFDLKLSGFDAKSKIKVIKEVRAISGLGLKEAKELVEGVPKVVKKDLKLEEAEELKKRLEDIGATVELD
eukprot:CAMPEP_0203665798 /NCGR_PEP_ID=MMETSP0090-20130426/2961_1 /ASSEMBLY_ACC=CAM_ASM_001088 /TAXON_ID=426623 /ORGANISM="Chaetoceros affinis, Strain CCMP159" /LENGTH=245 /DNA_ID=CAMNT_0050529483 /DNA_START=60 /DNA_END=797 /DNA_ORIENTATION=-